MAPNQPLPTQDRAQFSDTFLHDGAFTDATGLVCLERQDYPLMPNPWFRLYEEFATDPKVQTLPHVYQRHLVMLFCAKCRDILGKVEDEELAHYLGISEGEMATTKSLLLRKGFIDDRWNLINWNKRQFVSDSSTERVRRYRASKQAVKRDETHETKCNVFVPLHRSGPTPINTPLETGRNVTVTAPEADTDTETEEKEREKKKPFVASLPEWMEKDVWDSYREMRKKIKKPLTPKAEELAINRLEKFRDAGQDPIAIVEQSVLNSWQGLFEVKTQGAPPPEKKKYRIITWEEQHEIERRKMEANDAVLL